MRSDRNEPGVLPERRLARSGVRVLVVRAVTQRGPVPVRRWDIRLPRVSRGSPTTILTPGAAASGPEAGTGDRVVLCLHCFLFHGGKCSRRSKSRSTDSSKRRRTESPGMEGVYERGNFRDLRNRVNSITDSESPQSKRYVWFFTNIIRLWNTKLDVNCYVLLMSSMYSDVTYVLSYWEDWWFQYLSCDKETNSTQANEKKMNFKMKIIRGPQNGKKSDKQNFSIRMLGE